MALIDIKIKADRQVKKMRLFDFTDLFPDVPMIESVSSVSVNITFTSKDEKTTNISYEEFRQSIILNPVFVRYLGYKKNEIKASVFGTDAHGNKYEYKKDACFGINYFFCIIVDFSKCNMNGEIILSFEVPE